MLTWEGYAEPEWVEPFKKETGADVKIVYVGSADEMFAKMQGSQGKDFDVVSFDTSIFGRYIDANLLAPLDVSKIPNAAHLAPEFQKVKEIVRGDKQYGLPFAWGSLPMIYDADTFKTPPESWEVMWDPQYAQQLISMDDANNCITWGALVVGVENPYNLSDADFDKVKAKLIEQKKLLLSYFAGLRRGREHVCPECDQGDVFDGRAATAGAEEEGRQRRPHHSEGRRAGLARLLDHERRRGGSGTGAKNGSTAVSAAKSPACSPTRRATATPPMSRSTRRRASPMAASSPGCSRPRIMRSGSPSGTK